MPISGSEPASTEAAGMALAVTAEALYLANLLLLPGVAFLGLAYLYVARRRQVPRLAACHIAQTFSASIWAGLLLVLVNGLILVAGGYSASHTWVILVTYFTVVHTTLVLLGMVGLARALAGRTFQYPFIGMAACGHG